MNWKLYRKKFRATALHLGYDEVAIKAALKYAKRLNDSDLPIIYNQDHFALLVGYDIEYLRRASNTTTTSFYRHFKIPKKTATSFREIYEPLPSLKEIQRWILDNILYKVPISPFSKAYARKSSIKGNARFHIKQKYVIRLDIKDFFPSILERDVYYIFRNMKYSQEVCGILTGLTTLQGELPQGAPTSPMLSNLFMRKIDKRISSYCISRSIRYTRYADDMTFSGNFNYSSLISFVEEVIKGNRLLLNTKKTKIMEKSQQQRTTGIVVNNKMNPPRSVRRKLRQDIHYLKKFGLSGHLMRTKNTRANYLNHLLGISNFILFINPNDRDALEAKLFIKTFLER